METYKKLAKKFNEAVEKSRWDKKLMLKVEHTSFLPLHRVATGRNQVSKMLDLATVLTEATAVHFETEPRYSSINIYVDSPVQSNHGFGRYKSRFIRLKDAKGRYTNVQVKNEWEQEEINVDRLVNLFPTELVCTFEWNKESEFLSPYQQYAEEEIAKFKISDPEGEYNDPILKRNFAKHLFRELVRLDLDSSYGNGERFKKLCDHCGFKIIRIFEYVEKFYIYRLDYLNVQARSMELGWTTSQTYNSLPEVLKISLVKDIKSVELQDLGIEGPGYYSHDDNMTIPADKVSQVKSFGKRFKSKKNKFKGVI